MSLVVSPSFTFLTEVQRVQMPAKQASGRLSSSANQIGGRDPSGSTEKLVNGTTQRLSTPSQRRPPSAWLADTYRRRDDRASGRICPTLRPRGETPCGHGLRVIVPVGAPDVPESPSPTTRAGKIRRRRIEWARNSHELLLIGTRGKITPPAPGAQFRASTFAAPRGRTPRSPRCSLIW
jgi:hypothetical protein